mgnify:CR=1 FL=1
MFKFTIAPKKGHKVPKKIIKELQDFINKHDYEIEQDYADALIEYIDYGSGKKYSTLNDIELLYTEISRKKRKK